MAPQNFRRRTLRNISLRMGDAQTARHAATRPATAALYDRRRKGVEARPSGRCSSPERQPRRGQVRGGHREGGLPPAALHACRCTTTTTTRPEKIFR